MIIKMARKLGPKTPPRLFGILLSLWGPFRGAGIKITQISADYRHIHVILKKRWSTTNYVGTQFGGSIYAMTDPFFMLMLIQNLGPDYIVWDKGATIDFVSPGRTELHADFKITDEILADITSHTESGEKYIFDLPVEVLDTNNTLVATVSKKLYVRKKRAEPKHV